MYDVELGSANVVFSHLFKVPLYDKICDPTGELTAESTAFEIVFKLNVCCVIAADVGNCII